MYQRHIESARRLVAKYGARCVWAQNSIPAADPASPWLPATPIPATYNVSIAFFSRGGEFDMFYRFLRGTDVPIGKTHGIMASQPNFIPTLTGTITRTVDGVTFGVKSLDPVAPAGIPILYLLDFGT